MPFSSGNGTPNPSAMFQEQASRNEASVSLLSLPISGHRKRSPVEYSMVLPIEFMFPNSFSLSSSVIKAVCGDAAHDSAFPYFMGKSVTIRNKLSATIVSTSICFFFLYDIVFY